MIDDLIDQLLETTEIKQVLKIKGELIKLHDSKARDYSMALVDYSQTFARIKEEAYKITISECEKQAGEQTGFRHKQIPEEIEVIKEAISLSDDIVRSLRVALGYQSQTSVADVLELSSQTKSE